jgi:hypothetical protein
MHAENKNGLSCRRDFAPMQSIYFLDAVTHNVCGTVSAAGSKGQLASVLRMVTLMIEWQVKGSRLAAAKNIRL